MDDQAVDVALRDKRQLLYPSIRKGAPFQGPLAMRVDGIPGLRVPQGLCHIRTAEQVFPILLDYPDTAELTVSEYFHVHIHASISALCSTSLGLVVSSL